MERSASSFADLPGILSFGLVKGFDVFEFFGSMCFLGDGHCLIVGCNLVEFGDVLEFNAREVVFKGILAAVEFLLLWRQRRVYRGFAGAVLPVPYKRGIRWWLILFSVCGRYSVF